MARSAFNDNFFDGKNWKEALNCNNQTGDLYWVRDVSNDGFWFSGSNRVGSFDYYRRDYFVIIWSFMRSVLQLCLRVCGIDLIFLNWIRNVDRILFTIYNSKIGRKCTQKAMRVNFKLTSVFLGAAPLSAVHWVQVLDAGASNPSTRGTG